jgi:type I restriction enzyme, S subunit
MWKDTTLGEYYDVRDGTHDSPQYVEEGYPLVTSKNLKNGKIDLSKIKYISEKDYQDINKRSGVDVGDVLMAMIGTIGNPVEIIEPPKFAIKNVALFKTNAQQSPAYLRYFLSHPETVSKMMSDAKGTTQKFVGLGYLRNFPILVPPLAEQERIVAKFDAAFAEIDKAVSTAESKESEVQALKTSILSKLLNNKSNGWESSYLEGVSSFISRGISPKYLESGGVRVLNQKCIRNHRINYDLARRHDIDLKKVSEERFIRLGDILINSTGQGTLGRVAQVRKEPNELTTIDSHITIVRPKSEIFYLDYFGYAAIAIEKIIQDAGQGTSGQTELAKSKVQNDFQICFPRSFSEQEAEVKKLDIVFEEIEIALKNLTKSKTNLYALKSAILKQELQPSEAA